MRARETVAQFFPVPTRWGDRSMTTSVSFKACALSVTLHTLWDCKHSSFQEGCEVPFFKGDFSLSALKNISTSFQRFLGIWNSSFVKYYFIPVDHLKPKAWIALMTLRFESCFLNSVFNHISVRGLISTQGYMWAPGIMLGHCSHLLFRNIPFRTYVNMMLQLGTK